MFSKVVCFDLDDTLYKERDFVLSAYREVAEFIRERSSLNTNDVYSYLCKAFMDGKPAFQCVEEELGISVSVDECLGIYRSHKPTISLSSNVKEVLETLKYRGCALGLITDGRSISQRNKLDALELYNFMEKEDIVISEEFGSEKPCIDNYRYFETNHPNAQFYYVGDNVKKDFLTPNRIGWTSICLIDDGRNIHKQDFDFDKEYLPQYKISNFREILNILSN